MAYEILRANEDRETFYKDCILHSSRQNCDMDSITGRKLGSCRLDANNHDNIKAFFDSSNRNVKEFNTKHSGLWNFDETGVALGMYDNSRVLASPQKRKIMLRVRDMGNGYLQSKLFWLIAES